MVKLFSLKSPDEWATTKQACRDTYVVTCFLPSTIRNLKVRCLALFVETLDSAIPIQCVSIKETNWVIHRIEIYPVDSVIQPLGQLGLVLLYLEFISGAVRQAPSIIPRISLAEGKNYETKHYDDIKGHIISPNGPMHDYVRRTNFTTKPRL